MVMAYPLVKHLYLSHSSRGILHSCKRKFEFRKLFKHPARDFGLAAEMGKALHAGLQSFLITRKEDEAIKAYMLAYPIDMCQGTMDKYSLEAGYNTLMSAINSSPLIENELATINCLDGITRPAIEVPFEINFEGLTLAKSLPVPVSYCGYIDAIFWNREELEFTVLDVKTIGKIDQDLSPKFQWSDQCIPYAMILEYMLGHEIKSFTVKYLVCKVDVMETTTQIHTFQKTFVDVQDWYKGVLVDVQTIRTFVDMQWFPRDGNGGACFAYNKKCPFYDDVCSLRDPEEIQEFIAQGGEDGKWEMPQLEQGDNKTLVREFKPWVKFGIPVPDDFGRV